MRLSNLYFNLYLYLFALHFTFFNTVHSFSTTKSDTSIGIVLDSENENDEQEWEFEWLLPITPQKKNDYISSSVIETTANISVHYESLATIDPPPEG